MIFKDEAAKVLTDNILQFWQDYMVDDENGGFYGRMDGQGVLHTQADKGIILNTRILWTFAASYRLTGKGDYRKLADRAYQYLMHFFFDTDHGGFYWMLDYEGHPVQQKKQVYAQAFAIYAMAEYYRINPKKETLHTIKDLYGLLEMHSLDDEKNGYLEAFDQYWLPLEDVRLSDKDKNAEKTMNTHLHVLEAYTNLYRIWPDDRLVESLRNLIYLMSNQFLSSQHHFHLFFTNDWKRLSDEVSFGHDIEGSWLLCEAAEVIGDRLLIDEVRRVALKMVDAALEGLDTDGGLMNEANPDGIVDTDKHWWPQAEALVGLTNAWQISSNPRYRYTLDQVWSFIKSNLIDPKGEWYWKISRDREVSTSEDKAGPWKCPYHNGRAMIELVNRL